VDVSVWHFAPSPQSASATQRTQLPDVVLQVSGSTHPRVVLHPGTHVRSAPHKSPVPQSLSDKQPTQAKAAGSHRPAPQSASSVQATHEPERRSQTVGRSQSSSASQPAAHVPDGLHTSPRSQSAPLAHSPHVPREVLQTRPEAHALSGAQPATHRRALHTFPRPQSAFESHSTHRRLVMSHRSGAVQPRVSVQPVAQTESWVQ